MHGGRLLYGDIHPGNFFNREDVRLEVGYFGMLVELADTLRELLAGPAAHHRYDRDERMAVQSPAFWSAGPLKNRRNRGKFSGASP